MQSVANSDFSWSHRSASDQSFPVSVFSRSLSATYQVFTVTFLSDRTNKVFTAILLQLVFMSVSPLGLPAYHIQSLQRRGERSSLCLPLAFSRDKPSPGASAYPPLKATESHQLPGIAPTPGSMDLDICWPPYSKVAVWPAS